MKRNQKSKDPVAPRGSQYIDGQLIHTATNQKLFLQTHVCAVYRVTLKANEPFSTLTAKNVMDKNYKKRQAHGVGSILEDRFVLDKEKSSGKTPFRPFVYYREIKDLQRSKAHSKFFVLSVDSEKSGLKYYEVYKCKTDELTQKIIGYIQQGMKDPGNMVREGQVLGTVTVPKDDPNMRRSLMYVEFQTSQESVEENGRLSTMYQVTSPTPPMGYEMESPSPSPPPVRRPSPIQAPVLVKPVMARAPPPPSPRRPSPSPPPRVRTPSPMYRRQSLSDWDGLNYIGFEGKPPRPVNLRDKKGPVYMYFSRQPNPHYRGSPSRGRTGSPDYNSAMYNGRSSDYYRY